METLIFSKITRWFQITRVRFYDDICFDLAKDILSDMDEVFLDYEWGQDGSVGRTEISCERNEVTSEAAVDYINHLQSLEVDSERYNNSPENFPAAPCESPIRLEAVFDLCEVGEEVRLAYEVAVYGTREEIKADEPVRVLDLNGSLGVMPTGDARDTIEEYIEVPF